jgi:RNA polymerase sigma factor (sigma-70 family)
VAGRDNERKLKEYARTRSVALRNEIALDNQDLVWFVSKRFTSGVATNEDMFHAGMLGLIQAIEKFDPNRGTQLSTYAVPYIQNEIRILIDNPAYLEDKEGYEVPDEYSANPFQEKLNQLYAAVLTEDERSVLDVILRTNDEPALSVNDIAKLLNISGKEVKRLYESGIRKMNQPWVCWYVKLLRKNLS